MQSILADAHACGASQSPSCSRIAGGRRPRLTKARGLRAFRLSLSVLLVLASLGLGATSAVAITRDAVLTRAKTWIASSVPYSQAKYFGGYRTDCSGYVSMCWNTGTSWSTSTFHSVAKPITAAELEPGDAMLKAGTHIRLFEGWSDTAHTKYVAWEQTPPHTESNTVSLAADIAAGYVPYRYNDIQDGPAISISSSPASVRMPTPFVLSGTLSIPSTGSACAVYVKKPGSYRWSYSSNRLSYDATASSSSWWYRYTPKLKGTYSFYVSHAAEATHSASVSKSISVSVK